MPSNARSPFWNYFIAIEEDINPLSRYIELDHSADNMQVHSLELCRLLVACAAEVEVVGATFLPPGYKPKYGRNVNIGDIREILNEVIPEISAQKVYANRFGLEFVPWRSLAEDKTPKWWDAYNQVKHARANRFERATVANVLDAIAGLFLLLVHRGRFDGRRFYDPPPRFLSTDSGLSYVSAFVGGGNHILFLEGIDANQI